MDQIRDFERFCSLVKRLTDTLRGPHTPIYSSELVESWWKALRHVDFAAIEQRVDAFIAKADDNTKFPKPAQMRPKDLAPPEDGAAVGNPVRDHWRSAVLNDLRDAKGLRWSMPFDVFAHAVVRSPSMLRAVRELIDELCDQEHREGRSHGMALGCRRRCSEIANSYPFAAEQIAA